MHYFQTKVDRLQGADAATLESKIQQYYGSEEGEDVEGVAGHVSINVYNTEYVKTKTNNFFQMDLSPFISKSQCECLNESDDHPLPDCLASGGGFLQSDCDEQLIINITFNQSVKIHSLKVKAPSDKGPKHIRIFINQPRTLDFDMVDSYTSVQDLE